MNSQYSLNSLLRILGHDIQNNLGVIISGLELVQENTDNKEAIKKYCSLMSQATQKLSETVRTLIHSGTLTSEQQKPIDISNLLLTCIELVKPLYKKQKININVTLSEKIKGTGNESLFFQAILNLLIYITAQCEKNETLTISTTQSSTTINLHFEYKAISASPITSTPSLEITEDIFHMHNINYTIKNNTKATIEIVIPN